MIDQTDIPIPTTHARKRASVDVLFLCLARDCAETIPRFFSYLAELRDAGLTCSAVIGENGSSDNTRGLIEQLGAPATELLDTSFMSGIDSRLGRMAAGREALLMKARERAPRGYVIVADLDNVAMQLPKQAAVLAAMEKLASDNTLFAVGATSTPVYYDLLALRTDEDDFSNLNSEIRAAKGKPMSYYGFHRRRIYARQALMTRAAPIRCASSFNGFCIYRAGDYLRGTYRSRNESDVCEHVTLNLALGRSGQQMLISPSLVVQTPSDHAQVAIWRFWLDRLRKYAGRQFRL